jgi:hypothetical protein
MSSIPEYTLQVQPLKGKKEEGGARPKGRGGMLTKNRSGTLCGKLQYRVPPVLYGEHAR